MNKKIKLMSLTGVLTALIFVFAGYLHFPVHIGYVHIADGFIYFAACVLPLPYAMFAGAAGAVLADVLTGFPIWAPATVIIKALTVLFFSRKGKIFKTKNIIGLISAGLLCIIGYYLYEALYTGSMIIPIECMPVNIIQAILSSVLFVFLGFSADRLNLKEKIL